MRAVDWDPDLDIGRPEQGGDIAAILAGERDHIEPAVVRGVDGGHHTG